MILYDSTVQIFLQSKCPSCHKTVSVKVLKGTQSLIPTKKNHPMATWPHLFLIHQLVSIDFSQLPDSINCCLYENRLLILKKVQKLIIVTVIVHTGLCVCYQ